MFENISNEITTNIFESYSGHLNVAPIKISGQYKIVVGLDDTLYLDDYNGRRIPIDLTKKFLPQVANFLRIKTTVVDDTNLRFGGFQKLTKLSYHIPSYLNTIRFAERTPRYGVVARVLNEELNEEYKLQKYADLLRIVDFQKNGLSRIIDEIISECPDYPLYMNLEERQYTIYGYGINDECWTQKTIDTTHLQANQTYVDVFNNKINNAFEKNDIFFPRFLNIEFEFEFVDNVVPFNNFYGYLSYGEPITIDEFNGDLLTINVKDYEDYIVWKQEKYPDKIAIENYKVEVGNVSALKTTLQNPQVRFKVPTLNAEDSISIYNPDGTIFWQHVILSSEIYPDSLYKTLYKLCDTFTRETGGEFEFKVDQNFIIKVKSNVSDIYEEQYRIEIPSYCVMLDRYSGESNYNNFIGVTSYDIRLSREIKFDEDYLAIEINNIPYKVVSKFLYNGNPYIRCVGLDDVNQYPVFTENDDVIFFNILESKLYRLPELPFYTVNSELRAERQFNKKSYIDELHDLFDEIHPAETEPSKEEIEANNAFKEAANHFAIRNFSDTLPYIAEDENAMENVEANIVLQDDNNDETIKTMMFNSFGSTGFITPNIANIDKHLYLKNGNPDYYLQDIDTYAFHWFLIKGRCPNYMKEKQDNNDIIYQLRYFGGSDDPIGLPKLTSRIIRVNENYCETIFLGVKYMLPLQYENYQFAVYLDFQNELDTSLKYRFEIDNRRHTIYLVLRRYIDFCDLIRGGFRNNEPLLDLSFFYSVSKAYNTQSDFLDGFSASGLLICDEEIPVMFNTTMTKGWKTKYENKWYVCVKNSPSSQSMDFREIFPSEGNGTFYLYAELEYNGTKYTYISATIKFTNIYDCQADYLWCEDVAVRFFDTKNIFIQKLILDKEEREQEWFYVPQKNILNYVDESDNIFGDFVKIADVLLTRYDENGNAYDSTETFKLRLPDKELSLKQHYFEINKDQIEIDDAGNRQTQYSYFYFPEFFHADWGINELLENFQCESFFDSFISGNVNKEPGLQNHQRITLFDRNQSWYFIREYVAFDAMFKYSTEEQIRRLINQFLIINLVEYSGNKSIPISKLNDEEDETESMKFGYVPIKVESNDYNNVIWNMITINGYENQVIDIARYKAPYLPYLKLLANKKDFQKLAYRKSGNFFNIYDPNFGGQGVNATGIWKEIQGNIVSSLFCKNQNVEITLNYSEQINWYELFKSTIKLDECVIDNNLNEEYIEKIDQNITEYILDEYAKYLIFEFYKLDRVENELQQRLSFTTDKKDPNIIYFKKLSSYDTNFHYMKLIFVRK